MSDWSIKLHILLSYRIKQEDKVLTKSIIRDSLSGTSHPRISPKSKDLLDWYSTWGGPWFVRIHALHHPIKHKTYIIHINHILQYILAGYDPQILLSSFTYQHSDFSEWHFNKCSFEGDVVNLNWSERSALAQRCCFSDLFTHLDVGVGVI